MSLLVTHRTLKAAIIIDFGSATISQNLPYVEDGFTFTGLLGNSRVLGSSINTDRYLNLVGVPAGSNVSVRLTGTSSFDLNSVDIEGFGLARAWTFVASSGATLDLPGGSPAGTIDFTSLAGWKNLSFVDVMHDDAQANANMRLDNFNVSVSAIPEPSCGLLFGAVTLVAGLRRRRLSQRSWCFNDGLPQPFHRGLYFFADN